MAEDQPTRPETPLFEAVDAALMAASARYPWIARLADQWTGLPATPRQHVEYWLAEKMRLREAPTDGK